MLTPEELEALQQLSGINPHFNPLPQPAQPQAVPAAPVQADLAEPYNRQAQSYQQQAAELESQKPAEYPQAHGTKEHLVEAARAAMESFGRWGAPGGYEGQEAQRQKNFQTQQNDETKNRLDRAKQLRGQAQQQQELGQTVVQRGETNKYNEGNLEETRRLRKMQEDKDAREAAAAGDPKFTPVQPGQPVMRIARGEAPTFTTAPGSAPAPARNQGYRDKIGNNDHTIREYFDQADPSKVTYSEDLGAKRDASADDMQIVQGKVGPDGQPTYIRVPKNGPAGAITIGGNTIAPKDPEAPTVLKNQANSANTTMQMATIVRNLVTAKPQLVGAVAGRVNELALRFGDNPEGITAAVNGMQPGDEKDAAMLAGHMAYLFLNEARATMPGRPSKDYMDFVKSRSAQMSQSPKFIEGYLQSAENNARIILKQAADQGYRVGGPPAAPGATPGATPPGATPPAAGPKRIRIN